MLSINETKPVQMAFYENILHVLMSDGTLWKLVEDLENKKKEKWVRIEGPPSAVKPNRLEN